MKKLLFALVLFSQAALAQNLYMWDVISVVDGDTVKFKVDFLPKDLKPQLSVRVLGVDTPEKAPRAKCEKEAQLAEKASAFTKQKVASTKNIAVVLHGWDKYGGRVLGEILIDNKPLSKMLVEEGLARPYDGGKKQSWCE